MNSNIIYKIVFLVSLLLMSKYGYSQCSNPPSYNDPASQTGNLEMMNIPCAWTITNGNPNIVVAVVDDYLDAAHTDLVGKVVEVVGQCDPAQGQYHHGNQSLGAVAAIRNNGVCVAGSGGNTKVAAFCNCADNSTLLDVMNRGYKIVSISCLSSFSKSTIETLTNNGVVVLLAGLEQYFQAADPNGLHSVPGVIHCGRALMNGDFWQYGSLPNMNLDVLSVPDGMWRIEEGNSCGQAGGGTSIGTPHVAGVVALMMDVNPCLTPSDYEEILVATSRPIPSNAPFGSTRGGIIDAYAAVQMAQNFQGIDKTWAGNQTISMEQISGNLTIASNANILMNGKLVLASNKNIYIESGAKLTITGTVELGEDAKIIVKRGAEMLVNGGVITNAKGPNNCYKGNQWGAIIVEGNANQPQQLPGNVNDPNGNGVLHLIDATIENGHTMILMDAGYIPWPQTKDYWGGHVTALGTTFRNTNNFSNYTRVAAFMQYGFEDRSIFKGCTISNVAGGMTHWSNHGVNYVENTFDMYQKHALLTYDASIDVYSGNVFDNGSHDQFDQAAIDLYQTFPISSGSIIGLKGDGYEPNRFYGGYNSVFSEAGYTLRNPILVENNVFTGGQYNVRFDGVSRHDIKHNDMISPVYATTIVSNGSQFNTQSENQFSSAGVGIFSFYDNQGYDFLSNCFDYTSARDVRIHQGEILYNQGNEQVAASNVFSSNTLNRRITISGLNNDPSNPYFQYHILKETPPTDRTVPGVCFQSTFGGNFPNVSSVYNVFDALDEEIGGCGTVGTPGPIYIPPFVCNIPNNCNDIPAYIIQLQTSLAQENGNLQNYVSYSAYWYATRYRITEILKCIQKAKQKYIYCKGKAKDYEAIKNEYKEDELLYQSSVYGIMVENQDYSIARFFLQEMNNPNEETNDFIITQNINLNRLENYTYKPSGSEISTLYSIGQKTFPTSGYARSLYRYFTGEKLELNLPYTDEDILNPRSTDDYSNMEVNIAPNPTLGHITLHYDNLPKSMISVYSIEGYLVFENETNDKTGVLHMDISQYANGLYYILVRDQGSKELLHSEKIVLLK